MIPVPGDLRPDMIDAEIQYIRRADHRPWFFLLGEERSDDEALLHYERVRMHNVRGEAPHYDVEGFCIAPHRTSLTDFRDAAQIDGPYARELEEIVREVTGAARAIVTGIRAARYAPRSDKFGARGTTFPASIAHDDYTEETGPAFIAAHLEPLGPEQAAYWSGRRAAIFSMWRAWSPPPQDVPVCMCDARSVADEDRQGVDLFFGAGPKAQRTLMKGSRYVHQPRHRWCYFRDMTRDEILFIKCYDTDHARAWHVPHASFVDPTAGPDAPPRESLDVRVIALWE